MHIQSEIKNINTWKGKQSLVIFILVFCFAFCFYFISLNCLTFLLHWKCFALFPVLLIAGGGFLVFLNKNWLYNFDWGFQGDSLLKRLSLGPKLKLINSAADIPTPDRYHADAT